MLNILYRYSSNKGKKIKVGNIVVHSRQAQVKLLYLLDHDVSLDFYTGNVLGLLQERKNKVNGYIFNADS